MPALAAFAEKIRAVEAMIEQERARDPSNPSDRPLVLGLRCGAAVMMVAAFERFLREVFKDYVSFLDCNPPMNWSSPLPESIRLWNIYENLRLVAGHHLNTKRKQLIAEMQPVRNLCDKLSKDIIVADAFSSMKSNPTSTTLRMMFQKLGVDNIFQEIHAEFASIYHPIPLRLFIETELDRIVKRRHDAAHTADATQFTGTDLVNDLQIMKSLAKAIDSKLKQTVDEIIVKYASLGMACYSDLSSLFR